MQCGEFENHLNEIIDARRPPGDDPELAAHAEACAPCETLLRSYEALLEGVASRATVNLPLGFTECVVAEYSVIPTVKVTAWQRSRRVAAPALAMAATLLIAALPAMLWMRGRSAEEGKAPSPALASNAAPSATPASATPKVVAQENGPREAAAPQALVDQARETYEPLIAATSERLASVSGVIPGASGRSMSADDALAYAEDSSADRAGMNDQFAGGIRPVATSAGRSVVALLRVFPGAARDLEGQGVAQ